MKNKRSVYLKRNTVMSLTFEALTIICGFIIPRFILRAFGSETNGLVSSITHFLGFISLCELGMGAVVPASLYRPLAEKNMDRVSAVVASAQKFYRVIAVILLGYIMVLVGVYPLAVKDSFDFIFSASLILIISISTFAQYYFGITYTLLLKSDQKQYISFIINSVTLVLNTVISIILIKCGFSIHIVKLASSIIFIARPLCLNLYVKKHYKLNLKVKYEGEPIKQKWNGIAQHFAATIQEKADTVILTLLSSLTSVSVYGVYFMVINGIKGLIYSLTAGVSAMLGNMLAKEETEQLNKTFAKFEWLMHTLSTYLFTVTGILAVPFVKVYTLGLKDADEYIVPAFSAVLCMALAARCLQMPYNTMVQVAGHFKQTQKSAMIEPILNIIVSVVLVYKFGLIGVAVGTLVSMGYRVIYLSVYLMKNILFTKPMVFIKQICVDALSVLVMVAAVCWLKLNSLSFAGWILLALPVAFICLAVCLLINLIFYKEQLFLNLRPILNKLRRKK